jgi:hypothetical protein
MPAIYQALGTHEVLIYILLAIGAMFSLRWLWRSWREWRHAVYGLEKEFALRRMSRAIASMALVLILFCGELATASFILPNLPASMLVPTTTPDLLATPTGTISPELATAIALTPRPSTISAASSGCVPNRVDITAPEAGREVSGTVDIRGTASIPDFGFYKYEVTTLGGDVWSTISAGRDKVINGSLGQWDTTAVSPGDYELRLVVTDNEGRSLTPCIIQVRIVPPA